MKKDVLVTVRGMQSIESVDGSEEVEMVAKEIGRASCRERV